MVISEWSESEDILADLKALTERCLKETGHSAGKSIMPKVHFNKLLELGVITAEGTITPLGIENGLPASLTVFKY